MWAVSKAFGDGDGDANHQKYLREECDENSENSFDDAEKLCIEVTVGHK